MTDKETFVVVLDLLLLVVVNFLMYRQKKTLYESKSLWIYYLGVKSTVVLPAIFTGLQLYVFAFSYVETLRCPMFHLVMYCYIGYLIIVGFILFMEEYQVNLLRIMSVVLLAYQGYMAYQLIYNRSIVEIMMDSPMNPFRYGDTMGYFLCLLGPLLSVAGTATVWHYWRANNRVDFTH